MFSLKAKSRKTATNLIRAILLAGLLSGCKLMPGKVEFFQHKVPPVPTATKAEKETEKEAAALASKKADETYRAAIKEDTSEAVLEPAADTAALTRAVSTSLGPPIKPWNEEKAPAVDLAAQLEKAVAKLDRRYETFEAKQAQDVGKKIEGTGFFQIPYFLWLIIVGALVLLTIFGLSILWTFVKISCPQVAVGSRIASMGGSLAARAFGQVVQAGENYKEDVVKSFDSDTAKKVLSLFQHHHAAKQDQDVQSVVRDLTQK